MIDELVDRCPVSKIDLQKLSAVDGVPRPNISFTRAGSVLHSTPSENGASQLIIKPEGAADFGDYTCIAKNHLGSVQKIIKIKQIGKKRYE